MSPKLHEPERPKLEIQLSQQMMAQEGVFERLGNPNTIKVNTRVIAATNRNLKIAIEKKNRKTSITG